MKYIKILIITAVFTLIVHFSYDISLVTSVENFDSENYNIENINTNISNANIEVLTTINDNIYIEHTYSERSLENNSIYLYYDDSSKSLNVEQYLYNDKVVRPLQTIKIYIPKSYNDINFTINGENINLNMERLGEAGSINITTTGESIVKINDVIVHNIDIVADRLTLLLNNIQGTNLNVKSNYLNSDMEGIVENELNIDGQDGVLKLGDYSLIDLNILGENLDVYMVLDNNKNYKIDTLEVVSSDMLVKKNNVYTYNGTKEDKITKITIGDIGDLVIEFDEEEGNV